MNQDALRKQVRLLKAVSNISYKELSGYVGIKVSSMYNWLKGQYELSFKKYKQLEEIISILQE